MITLGNLEICAERNELLGLGTIIAFVTTDVVVRFWLGNGSGVDFLAGECKAQDGSRFLFGRLRFHGDDEIFSTKDHKEVIQVGAGADVPEQDWEKTVGVFLSTSEPLISKRREIEVNGPVGAFMKKFESLAPAFGFQLGFKAYDLSGEDK